MAGNVQVSVKDRASATAWLNNVSAINQDYHVAMQEAAQTLTDMQNFADGTIVDEFVNLGSNLLNAAEKTFEAIDAIADTVTNILNTVEEFVDGAKNFITNTVSKIFG